MVRRHHAVLEALGASRETRVVTITVRSPEEEYSPELAAEPWPSPGVAEELGVGQLFVNEGPLSALNGLLRMVANDECRGVMILPVDLTWIFHPYDGGADVITATSAERDWLAARFASWRSARPDGL